MTPLFNEPNLQLRDMPTFQLEFLYSLNGADPFCVGYGAVGVVPLEEVVCTQCDGHSIIFEEIFADAESVVVVAVVIPGEVIASCF